MLLKSADPGGGSELNDLSEDSAETRNLATVKPEIFKAMKARMAEFDESCRRSRDGAGYEF